MFGFSKKGSFPQSQLIPSIIKLGEFLKNGFEHRLNLREKGIEMDLDTLTKYIGLITSDWNPKVDGKEIFDKQTKEHAIRFIAGIAYNLTREHEDVSSKTI